MSTSSTAIDTTGTAGLHTSITVTAGLYTEASPLTLSDWKSEGGEGTGSDDSTTQKHHTVTAGLYIQASPLTLWDWKSEGARELWSAVCLKIRLENHSYPGVDLYKYRIITIDVCKCRVHTHENDRCLYMVCDQCQNVVVTFYVFKQKVRWSQSRGCSL